MDWQDIQAGDIMVVAALLCLLTVLLTIVGGVSHTVGIPAGRYLIYAAVPVILLVIVLLLFGIMLEAERQS